MYMWKAERFKELVLPTTKSHVINVKRYWIIGFASKLVTLIVIEKSVGTTELDYSMKKREHSFSILKNFFR